MSIETEIYDYVDESGRNLIKAWIDGIGVRPKAKINTLLLELENDPLAEWHKHKFVEKLKGTSASGLWEIKTFVDKVRWRPIRMLWAGGDIHLTDWC